LTGRAEVRAFLGLGGNLGDPVQAMGAALRLVDADKDTRVVSVSSVYRTPPWGKTDQPDFLNCAAEIATGRDPRSLLELCLATEQALKRVRRERWGPRTVDLDVLVYGEAAIAEPGLAIPHPRMMERAFVMVPLAEIAPDLVLSGDSVAAHAAKLDRAGIVRLDLPRDWWLGAGS
jgi:2-amino-4-hydroxy-6-hydroxymethyldihydropteridine diphosphokinase